MPFSSSDESLPDGESLEAGLPRSQGPLLTSHSPNTSLPSYPFPTSLDHVSFSPSGHESDPLCWEHEFGAR